MERSPAAPSPPAAGSEKRAEATLAKRPIKVVRISNPMKFQTSPSDFPALVQRLTGQGSDIVDIMAKYHPAHDAGDSSQIASTNEEEATPPPPPPPPAAAAAGGAISVCPLELLNGAFDSRLPESFPWRSIRD